MGDEVLLFVVVERVQSTSGVVHKRYRAEGRLVDDPRCNLDDMSQEAGRLKVLTNDEFAAIPEDDRCGHCWPRS